MAELPLQIRDTTRKRSTCRLRGTCVYVVHVCVSILSSLCCQTPKRRTTQFHVLPYKAITTCGGTGADSYSLRALRDGSVRSGELLQETRESSKYPEEVTPHAGCMRLMYSALVANNPYTPLLA